jgi:hypothetical protein
MGSILAGVIALEGQREGSSNATKSEDADGYVCHVFSFQRRGYRLQVSSFRYAIIIPYAAGGR